METLKFLQIKQLTRKAQFKRPYLADIQNFQIATLQV